MVLYSVFCRNFYFGMVMSCEVKKSVPLGVQPTIHFSSSEIFYQYFSRFVFLLHERMFCIILFRVRWFS
jgi:hypothetical protein